MLMNTDIVKCYLMSLSIASLSFSWILLRPQDVSPYTGMLYTFSDFPAYVLDFWT